MVIGSNGMLEMHVGRGNGGRQRWQGGIDVGTQAGLRRTWAKSSRWKMSNSQEFRSPLPGSKHPLGLSHGAGCAVGDDKPRFPVWG